MPKPRWVLVFLGFLILSVPQLWAESESKTHFHISSQSFKAGGPIPDEYTCKGQNISPEVQWTGVPLKTKSFALVMEDPDAPVQIWTHWIIYNIPVKELGPDANVYELTENYPRDEETAGGILQGTNDFKKIGYDGPCPPSGIHRYYFELYALDSTLAITSGVIKEELLAAMKGHVLAKTQMMGTYSK